MIYDIIIIQRTTLMDEQEEKLAYIKFYRGQLSKLNRFTPKNWLIEVKKLISSVNLKVQVDAIEDACIDVAAKVFMGNYTLICNIYHELSTACYVKRQELKINSSEDYNMKKGESNKRWSN